MATMGKRGIGLNKPCPKCGNEVPSSFVSPLGGGLCGKCTDEAVRNKPPRNGNDSLKPLRSKASIVKVVPGGGSTIIGFSLGLGLGILGSIGIALFVPGFWGNIIVGLKGIFG